METVTGRRRPRALAAALATLAITAGLAAAPAQAVDKEKYIALGDSYAAGQGAGPYLDACYRSNNAYSELADEAKSIKLVVNAACSGATTQDVVNTQLRRLNKSTELVTITAGGNNIGFGDIITYGVVLMKVPPAPECGGALARAEAQLQGGQLKKDLASMIRSVRAAAPNARIVLTGYPYLLDPIPAGLTDPAAQFIHTATGLADRLNQTIAAAAQDADAAAVNAPRVQYVDVRDAFLGHGALSPVPRINLGADSDGFHPNAAGYRAYFAALSGSGAYSLP